MRLVEVADELKLHKATATRLLGTLATADMVIRDDRGYFSLGSGIALLSARLLSGYRGLVNTLRTSLLEMWEVTQETVTVHVRVGLQRICIEELEGPQIVAYRTGIGSRVLLHVGSGGKVLLAFLPSNERDQLVRDLRMTALTKRTITSRTQFAAELEEVQRLGYAISTGERTLAVC
jgi:DNA-binding IclR family transcriptional regulator